MRTAINENGEVQTDELKEFNIQEIKDSLSFTTNLNASNLKLLKKTVNEVSNTDLQKPINNNIKILTEWASTLKGIEVTITDKKYLSDDIELADVSEIVKIMSDISSIAEENLTLMNNLIKIVEG